MSRDREPGHDEPVSIQLRVARVENRLNEPTREGSDLDDTEILAFVRVRRSLFIEFHRKAGKVCRTFPPPPPPGEYSGDQATGPDSV
jgi:hypothetical protein